MPKGQPLEQRFWSKVDKRGPDECWTWAASRNHKGYGKINVDGRPRKATQIAWELTNGVQFPAGKIACHECDNPACVNPAHIWPGTYSQNTRDMMAKGRHVTGRRRPGEVSACIRCGHPRQDDYVYANGNRVCRACKSNYAKANREARNAAQRRRHAMASR